METSQKHLVVLGAGVIGLTVAYLAATDPDVVFSVTVVARDMPEDMNSQAWTSPFAGANWAPLPAAATDKRVLNWELASFNKFWDMIPTGLVKKLPSSIYLKQAIDTSELWWGNLVRELHELDRSEIPEPYKFGLEYYTISVNPQEYIPWLKSELLSRGVSFEQWHVNSLEDLRPLVGPEGVLVNASSLGSRSIIGVEDTKLYPIRGQTIVVKSPLIHGFAVGSGTINRRRLNAEEESTYIIPRPGTKYTDTVILGGTFQSGNWDTSLDMDIAKRIFERCAELAPSLKNTEVTKILKHQVGLRPAREGGARVEAEAVKFPLNTAHNLVPWDSAEGGSMQVVHAYGFGGGGYQASWGAAAEVLALVKKLE
ncbi:FAD dependent oxidoreductase [Boletus edulis BED1]|uniref:FAD dependent oxidoreductase n=1 Tax=Boletus edulis BED1 TaxID=1328754 RepID=A0AAD4GJ63_BOLED|nr:FAD dependent oxidoreductase [Boletus edulis BED1]